MDDRSPGGGWGGSRGMREVSGALETPSPYRGWRDAPRSSTPLTVLAPTKNSGVAFSIFSEFRRCLKSLPSGPLPQRGIQVVGGKGQDSSFSSSIPVSQCSSPADPVPRSGLATEQCPPADLPNPRLADLNGRGVCGGSPQFLWAVCCHLGPYPPCSATVTPSPSSSICPPPQPQGCSVLRARQPEGLSSPPCP